MERVRLLHVRDALSKAMMIRPIAFPWHIKNSFLFFYNNLLMFSISFYTMRWLEEVYVSLVEGRAAQQIIRLAKPR